MKIASKQALLQDHVDQRMITTKAIGQEKKPNRRTIVQLDPDHPGFRDQEYRARRNQIAQIAEDYETDSPIPDAPYTDEDLEVWRILFADFHQFYSSAGNSES